MSAPSFFKSSSVFLQSAVPLSVSTPQGLAMLLFAVEENRFQSCGEPTIKSRRKGFQNDRLADVVIHAGGEALFAGALHRMSSHRDDIGLEARARRARICRVAS